MFVGNDIAQQARDIICGVLEKSTLETASLVLENSIVGDNTSTGGFKLEVPTGTVYDTGTGLNASKTTNRTYTNKVVFTFSKIDGDDSST